MKKKSLEYKNQDGTFYYLPSWLIDLIRDPSLYVMNTDEEIIKLIDMIRGNDSAEDVNNLLKKIENKYNKFNKT